MPTTDHADFFPKVTRPALGFPRSFELLTGVPPFPWQERFYSDLIRGRTPGVASIPTGLGKTSIVAIWLIALARYPHRLPRRLVYVVNRRTVVDQTTTEVERLRTALMKQDLADLRAALASLHALPLPSPDSPPLAISTLRGQFADNGEWCADPSRPAVIVGTVDMIGSGLLFSRYTRGFKTRPLHAGFLGQDSLLVHDEAHLEPSFQKLLESIVTAQNAESDPRKLNVIELTATSRAADINGAPVFTLTKADFENAIVNKRFNAIKGLSLVALDPKEKLEERIVKIVEGASSERALLIFSCSVETAVKIAAALNKGERKGRVATLTGTMRGKERDELVTNDSVFQRFLQENDRAEGVTPADGTVFLVATSAGEVGVNISADDLVCDLTSYESMAQRFGRVNRFGKRDDSKITVVHETQFDTSKPLETARERTLALLKKLKGRASPAALEELPSAERFAAFSPEPARRVATEIQFDAWALTSIRQAIAARPPVELYLHGEAEWQPAETHLAWRDDCDFRHVTDPEAFLDDFPLKPAELLRDTTTRIVKTLGVLLAQRPANSPDLPDAWLLADNGSVSHFKLSDFDNDQAHSRLANAILLLPASVGGLSNGLFNAADDTPVNDVSTVVRHVTESGYNVPPGHRLVRAVELTEEDAEEQRILLFLKRIPGTATLRAALPETLAEHTNAVVANAAAIASKFFPETSGVPDGEPDLRRCIVVAACLHDLGKNRSQWQRNLGNYAYDPAKPETILAKSAPGMRPRTTAEHYRHEFGSLDDAVATAEFATLNEDERDIVLHLVAAHHGRARPHFPHNEIFDYSARRIGPEAIFEVATEIPRRFARLQTRFGRWGLAWLESILRAADYAATAGIVAPSDCNDTSIYQGIHVSGTRREVDNRENPTSQVVTLAVNPTNPGHYFACCGLFELATRLTAKTAANAHGVQAWFDQDPISRDWYFNLTNTSPLTELLERIATAEFNVLDISDNHSAVEISSPFHLRLDWWRHEGRATGKLKTWAGQMKAYSIIATLAAAVARALRMSDAQDLFALEAKPIDAVSYFDAPRSANATARDVGFSMDKLKKGGVVYQSILHPTVEFFCLIGLQRCRPALVPNEPRLEQTYAYYTWSKPITPELIPAAAIGLLPDRSPTCYHFANRSRTSDYRAFGTANIISTI